MRSATTSACPTTTWKPSKRRWTDRKQSAPRILDCFVATLLAMSSLDRHHGVAQAVDREHRAIARVDRYGGDDAAGDDHHAARQAVAAFGAQIDQPGQGLERIFGAAFVDRRAVHGQSAGNANQVGATRDRRGGAQYDAAV